MQGEVDPAHVLVALLGAGILALATWAWAGRSRRARWWVGRPWGPELVLAVLPGLGLLVLGGGLLSLLGTAAALLLVPMLLGAVLALMGMLMLVPRWWGPRWYRRLPPSRRWW
jgi:lysylphosphatidylglycerol synthetase-like protein (DUF2156 family)